MNNNSEVLYYKCEECGKSGRTNNPLSCQKCGTFLETSPEPFTKVLWEDVGTDDVRILDVIDKDHKDWDLYGHDGYLRDTK